MVPHIGEYFDNEHYQLSTTDKNGERQAIISYVDNQRKEHHIAVNAFISAIGYDLNHPTEDPLYQDFVDQGLIRLNEKGEVIMSKDGLTVEGQKHIYVSGIGLGSQGSVTDGTTHGPNIRGRFIVENILGVLNKINDLKISEKIWSDYRYFYKTAVGDARAAAFLTLAANQPGENAHHIEYLFGQAMENNSIEEAARYVAEVAGQSGKKIIPGHHYVIPDTRDTNEIVERIFKSEQPGFLGPEGRARIAQEFINTHNRLVTSPEAIEQLLYPLTQIGIGREKTKRLFDSFYYGSDGYPVRIDSFIAAVLTRAATSFVLPHINDNKLETGDDYLRTVIEKIEDSAYDNAYEKAKEQYPQVITSRQNFHEFNYGEFIIPSFMEALKDKVKSIRKIEYLPSDMNDNTPRHEFLIVKLSDDSLWIVDPYWQHFFANSQPGLPKVLVSRVNKIADTLRFYGLPSRFIHIWSDWIERDPNVFDELNRDAAQVSDPGGIDLAMTNADFQIKRDAKGIPLPVQFQNLENIHINGLTAKIVKDTVINNLPEFLGISVP